MILENGINDEIIEYVKDNKDIWSIRCCRAIALNGKYRKDIEIGNPDLLHFR